MTPEGRPRSEKRPAELVPFTSDLASKKNKLDNPAPTDASLKEVRIEKTTVEGFQGDVGGGSGSVVLRRAPLDQSSVGAEGLEISREGSEKCTLLRFTTGGGWLSPGAEEVYPVDALGVFTLSPDRKRLDKESDADVIRKSKEVVGMLRTRVLDLTGRVEKKQEEIKQEQERRKLEKKAKDEALSLLKNFKEKNEELQKALKFEKEEASRIKKANDDNLEKLQSEQGVSASLQTEVERLQKALDAKIEEVKKVSKTLEKVEKDALITYKDSVEKYLKSQEFDTLLYERADMMHEEGFNDCLQFVGIVNVLNPEIHSIDHFRAAELEKLDEGKPGSDEMEVPSMEVEKPEEPTLPTVEKLAEGKEGGDLTT